jgi:hypothetical protein
MLERTTQATLFAMLAGGPSVEARVRVREMPKASSRHVPTALVRVAARLAFNSASACLMSQAAPALAARRA